jgi:hypothetical protein
LSGTKKNDPLVKGQAVISDVLSPQLAEVRIGGRTQLINTRHLARASLGPGIWKRSADNKSIDNLESAEEPEQGGGLSVVPRPRVAEEPAAGPSYVPEPEAGVNDQLNANAGLEAGLEIPTTSRSGRIIRKPQKLNL